MITSVSLVTIFYNIITTLYICYVTYYIIIGYVPHTVNIIPMIYLFLNWKFIVPFSQKN